MANQPFQAIGQVVSKEAVAALSAYRVVERSGVGVKHAADGDAAPFGITIPGVGADLSDLVAIGQMADLALSGIVHVEYGATVALSDRLMAAADGSGKVIKATTGKQVIGNADVAGVDGDIGAVQIDRKFEP